MADIIWAVKQGGNRQRRNRRKVWRISRDIRRFQKSSRVGSPQKTAPSPRTDKVEPVKRPSSHTSHEIWLPGKMDFESNYEETAVCLRYLRNASEGLFAVRKLRFDRLREISPASALVLASEVDRWNQLVGGRLKAEVHRWQEDVKRLLFEMGYFELLHLPRPMCATEQNDLTFLKFLKGHSGEGDKGKLAKQLRINIEAIVGQRIRKRLLFDGLSEAITNVGQHAYPLNDPSSNKKEWWLSASYDKGSRNLYVVFYDQGIGIPSTLPRSTIFESMKEFFGSWSDSQKIQAAMGYGRSSTFRLERGKGLPNLVEFFSAHEDGQLSIYSHYGLFQMTNTPNKPRATILRDHKTSIGGTLIEWSAKL
ncbi:MAG TPA: hypothetical protein VIM11_11660 [Tepidisphaeraceae bacterium]|jgi:hypothetical protein